MIFRESRLAHHYLDGLAGLEIGGAAHNPFGLETKNVDYEASLDTVFKKAEVEYCGEALKVDIVASGDELPVPDESQDFVVSAHVIEHFFDPIKAIKEWLRVIKPGGYIFIIAPHQERTFDRDRARTPLAELVARHEGKIVGSKDYAHQYDEHCSVWITQDLIDLCRYLDLTVVAYQDVDDKSGNGFAVVLQKEFVASTPGQYLARIPTRAWIFFKRQRCRLQRYWKKQRRSVAKRLAGIRRFFQG
ncbi:MAG TPA: class I SAM-dependent methyltransferase [Opitutaceae bacterium]|jgi:SAM-dependent methyltransferase|nr:class I SAM-dependent methyltransferase [Opitutaceae bacterium]